MRKAILISLVAIGLAAPIAASAQPAGAATTDRTISISPGQWLAVGAGAVIGAMALDIILPVRIAYLVGGLAGGYIGDAWYRSYQSDIPAGAKPKL